MPTSLLARLRHTFTQYWSYFPLYTACRLNVLEPLSEAPQTSVQLAEKLQADAQALSLLLEALVELNILTLEDATYYRLTELGALLTETHPQSVKYSCLLWAEEHLTAWQQLPHTILTGQPAFEKHFGQPFFDYLNEQPRARLIYHRAMAEYARDDYANLADYHDFGQHKALLDLGGGLGALLHILRKRWPNLSLALLDLPAVVDLIPTSPTPPFEVVANSFFEPLPLGFDALLMSRVLHDWDDAAALKILQQAYAALPEGGRLYVLENLTEELEDGAKLLSLNMLLTCRSYERSLKAYCQLIHTVGFRLVAVQPLPSLPTLFYFEK